MNRQFIVIYFMQGRGRVSTVNFFVITSLDQFIFVLKILVTFVTKQSTLLKKPSLFSYLQPCLIFVGMTRDLHLEWAIVRRLLLLGPRLSRKY